MKPYCLYEVTDTDSQHAVGCYPSQRAALAAARDVFTRAQSRSEYIRIVRHAPDGTARDTCVLYRDGRVYRGS